MALWGFRAAFQLLKDLITNHAIDSQSLCVYDIVYESVLCHTVSLYKILIPFFSSLLHAATRPPLMSKAHRLYPPLFPVSQDRPPGSGGLKASLKGNFNTFQNRNLPCCSTCLHPTCTTTTPSAVEPSRVNVTSVWRSSWDLDFRLKTGNRWSI